MNDWLKQNAWSLIIAGVTLVSSFTLYGYRITAVEKQSDQNRIDIAALNTAQNGVNVQLAQISEGVHYLQLNFDRYFGKTSQ